MMRGEEIPTGVVIPSQIRSVFSGRVKLPDGVDSVRRNPFSNQVGIFLERYEIPAIANDDLS